MSRGTHCLNVGTSFNERLAHGVHSVLQGELQTRAIVLRKGAETESDPGQNQAFPGTQFATNRHFAVNIATRDMRDCQFHQTVVQEESVLGLYYVRQVFELTDTRCRLPVIASVVSVKSPLLR